MNMGLVCVRGLINETDGVNFLSEYVIEGTEESMSFTAMLQFGSNGFPVAGMTGDTASTREELMLKYPHVYPE